MTPSSLVLLGDSILDNRPYTAPDPDTVTHLRRLVAPARAPVLLARDGARMRDVGGQLDGWRGEIDVAVLSVGGNDVTAHLPLLDRRNTSAAALFGDLLTVADEFEREYARLAARVAGRAHRTVLCTIYEVRLEPPRYARLARVPLAVLNDRIIRVASGLGLDVLDLRSVCNRPEDFVLQIEPSAQGAAKIASAIAALVERPESLPSAAVFTAPRGTPSA